ncbi:MAG TPA: glycosyltransferase [Candidatus Gastranaerophilales bacterium]|nr:glycosyltransferase [Candidatus Gastranaerophilales bacterium]
MISIIIPAYNAENYIKNAINSVLNQTYQNFEIIIINDGSTDNTENVIKQFDDTRIKYFYQENQGVSSARNKGIELSQGEYIAFLDADDLWLPEKLQLQLDFLKKNPEISLVYSNLELIEESTGIKFIKTYDNFKNQKTLIKTLVLTPFNSPIPCSILLKKDVLLKAGLFDSNLSFGEDLELCIRIALISNLYCIQKPLAIMIRPKNSATRTMSPFKILQNNIYILNKFFNETDKNKIYSQYQNIAFAFAYFNIGFHYFFNKDSNNNFSIKTKNISFAFLKKFLRKIINFYISLI